MCIQPCLHREASAGSEMVCRMPILRLPDDLNQQLEDSRSGKINDPDGYGVAVYYGLPENVRAPRRQKRNENENENIRADIYVGLTLDGFNLYVNISSVNSSIALQFAVQPAVFPSDLDFNPNEDKIIAIKVNFCFIYYFVLLLEAQIRIKCSCYFLGLLISMVRC